MSLTPAINVAATPRPAPIDERGPIDAKAFAREILPAYRPVVLRNQVAGWPAVAAAREGPKRLASYIASFDRGQPVDVMIGPPEIGGRFFYREDMCGFNFTREKASLSALLARLVSLIDAPDGYTLYAGAAAAPEYLPGWAEANPLDLPIPGAMARVWIGNETHISTHYDASSNLACVVAGRRHFTLFPPDQIDNLYIGPIDTTMAGQPASMVDPAAPDLDRYPRFAEAAEHALAAELGPGDALFIPALWWHNVRATGPLNLLVNYWSAQAVAAAPLPVLFHALLGLRDLPAAEKRVWRKWFDHYVFSDGDAAVAHLPPHARGVLGPASPERSAALAAYMSRLLRG